jgi:hypothetical protein
MDIFYLKLLNLFFLAGRSSQQVLFQAYELILAVAAWLPTPFLKLCLFKICYRIVKQFKSYPKAVYKSS